MIELGNMENVCKSDSKTFSTWKNKVLSGNIDPETAKKDLKAYKEKVEVFTNNITEASDKFIQAKEEYKRKTEAFKSMESLLTEQKSKKE